LDVLYRLVDLGNWLGDNYRVPSESEEGEGDDDPEKVGMSTTRS
jgi:endogenous inhibitor of DNA gyrase (YacG/DUF329 family)